HTRFSRDWSSDVCSSDLGTGAVQRGRPAITHYTSAAGGMACHGDVVDGIDIAREQGRSDRTAEREVAIGIDFLRGLDHTLRIARSEERRVGKGDGWRWSP